MAKRSKSAEVVVNTKWDQILTMSAFEEENWSPCVAWIVGRQTEDFTHVEALNIIVQTGIRKLFSVITKEQLYLDVREIGNPKNRKAKDLTPNFEVCEACKVYLDANEPIPISLLAKLIKWKMMNLKESSINRKGSDFKKNLAGDEASDKRKGKEKERVRSPKKTGKKTPEPQQPKEGPKIKKRGEDDDENKYIDDEPEDGAKFYIIITGFHDPHLFQYLESMHVKINCVIGISSQDIHRNGVEDKTVALSQADFDKKEELRKELKVFWRDLLPILQHQPDTSTLHDIARLDYEVSSLIVPTDPHDTEQRVHYSTAIFEDIAVMLYNLQDAKRLYHTYLDNLKLYHIPVFGEAETSASTELMRSQTVMKDHHRLTLVDMRYYNDLMSTIPIESASVPIILHCMLEQVVATEQGSRLPSDQPPPARADGLNYELMAYLSDMTTQLGLSSQEQEMLSQVFQQPGPSVDKAIRPDLINFNDKICHRTRHLKPYYGLDAEAVERHMLQFLPFKKLCQIFQPHVIEQRARAVRLNELLRYCASTDLSTTEIDHAFMQFVFESMDLTKCDRNGFPLQRVKEGIHSQPIPWDDPYPYFRVMIPVSAKSTLENLTMPSSNAAENLESNFEDRSKQFKNRYQHAEDVLSSKKYSKFGEIQRTSDVIMEMVVSLDDAACNAVVEKPQWKKDENRGSPSLSDIKGESLAAPGISYLNAAYSPRQSFSNSVRFDVPSVRGDSENLNEDYAVSVRSSPDSLIEVNDAQYRNLESWCFAEHFTHDILMQVLQEATDQLAFFETYQHKRDLSLVIILHNPYNKDRHNNVDWHRELHSNTGFRNYLENTVESIQSWLKKKEAEYQAQLLSKEVANINKEEEEKHQTLDKKGKRSPQRSAVSKSKSPRGSASSSPEKSRSSFSNPYIRQGSLKALQAEQMKLMSEEEEKEKMKLEKRIRSSSKLNKNEKDKGLKQEKGAVRSTKDMDTASIHSTHSHVLDSRTDIRSPNSDPYWPFYGYDTGNQFIHVVGSTATLFPVDGGIIKTEKTEMVQGTVTVRSTLYKDGHTFVVHIINPREDMNLPEEYVAELEALRNVTETTSSVLEKSLTDKSEKNGSNSEENLTDGANSELPVEKDKNPSKEKVKQKTSAVSQYGSITAHLSDGMILALSQFGPTGESYLKPYKPIVQIISAATDVASRATVAPTPTKSRTSVSKNKTPVNSDFDKEKSEQDETSLTKERMNDFSKQDFQELSITCPDGLNVKYFLQSSVGIVPDFPDDRKLVVRQSYPVKTKGVQNCESVRAKYVATEISRVITADGDVIKNMVNGVVEVLGADGTVSVFNVTGGEFSSRDYAAYIAKHGSDSSRKGKNTAKNMRMKSINQEEGIEDIAKMFSGANWLITYPYGERIKIFKDIGKTMELDPLPVCYASDPLTQQTMATRDDHVIIVNYPDGASVVEHADGTRISSYYRDIAVVDNSISTQDEGAAETHSLQYVKFVRVESIAYATVEFNTSTSENLTIFDNETSINVFPDGYYMLHHKEGGRIEIDTTSTLTYFPCRSRFFEHLMPERELQYVLNHNANVIIETVDPRGNIFNVRSNGESVVSPSFEEDIFSSKSRQNIQNFNFGVFDHQAPRYFIIHSDGTGTELLRFENIADYLLMAEKNPAAAVLKEALPGHPGVTAITVLKPYISEISEKLQKLQNPESIIPLGLRCRDLKTLPPHEYKKPGPKFGTNVGKGLNIGEKFKLPVAMPVLKCPDKLEFRRLLQYKPVVEEMRKKLQTALSDYARAVVERMQTDSLMVIEDVRSENEKMLAQELKSMAEIQRPEGKELIPEQMASIYEQAVARPDTPKPTTHKAKRSVKDWEQQRRDEEEINEVKNLIKNRIFEPYFDSELGKSFFQIKDSITDETNHSLHAQNVPRKGIDYADTSSSHGKTYTEMQNVPHTVSKRKTISISSEKSKNESVSKKDESQTDSSTTLTGQEYESSKSQNLADNTKKMRRKYPFAHRSSIKTDENIHYLTHRGSAQMDKINLKKTSLKQPHKLSMTPSTLKSKYESITADEFNKQMESSQHAPPDIYGQSRSSTSIILPSSILGGKPGAYPNEKFKQVEEPVRRKVNTSSVAGATIVSTKRLSKMRGLICNPQSVDFGTLKEGNMYVYTVTLTNTGIDACRFKVRQPSPTSGLRVQYPSGSVAAGMSVDLNLELYAIASKKDESDIIRFSSIITIVTETDYLELPISANILTVEDYDNNDVVPHIPRDTNARRTPKQPYQFSKNKGLEVS